MTLVLLGAVLVGMTFIVVRNGQNDRPANPAQILIAGLLPALLLLLFVFWHGGSLERIRVALLGLGFRGEAGQELRVSVGGDHDRDDFWIAALEGADAPIGDLVHPGAGQALGVDFNKGQTGLLTRGSQGILRSVALQDGDLLRVGDEAWTWSGSTLTAAASNSAGGPTSLKIPRRTSKIPMTKWRLPILGKKLPASARTHPLARLEPTSRSFLYNQDGATRFAQIGSKVSWEPGGKASAELPPIQFADGIRMHVQGLPRWDGRGFTARGIRDLRSGKLHVGNHSFAYRYDSPELLTLQSRQLVERGATENDLDQRIELRIGAKQRVEGLTLRHASRAIELQTRAQLVFPKKDSEPIRIFTPAGARALTNGEPVWLGYDRLAAIQVDRLKLPASLAWFALLLAAARVGCLLQARIHGAALLLLFAADSLGVLRLLLGYRVWAMPPNDAKAYELALIALVLIPWCTLVAALPARAHYERWGEALKAWAPTLAGTAISMVWCTQIAQGTLADLSWIACHLLALALLWARSVDWPGVIASGRETHESLWARIDQHVLTHFESWGPKVWLALAAAVGMARVLGVLAFGWKESVALGSRFSLTIAHLPIALVIQAGFLLWLRGRQQRHEELRWSHVLYAVTLPLLLWLIPGWIASDLGLILLNLPVYLLALAVLSIEGWRDSHEARDGLGLRWQLSILPALLFIGVFCMPFALNQSIRLMPDDFQMRLLSERNYLRMLLWAYPAQVREAGGKESEQLAIMSAVLGAYTDTGLLGRGYGESELSPQLGPTSLREHAMAVFVSAEWGLLGAIGLVSLFFCVGLIAALRLPRARESLDDEASGAFPRMIGALAGGTFAVSSIWMILANYGLALFTGKNVRLLGLDSTEDILLSVILLVAIAAGLGGSRR